MNALSKMSNYQRLLLHAVGFIWGTSTAFSIATEDSSALVQGLALLSALILVTTIKSDVFQIWTKFDSGILISLHVAAAIVSYMNSDATLIATLRYTALLPAFAVMLTVAGMGRDATTALRTGLTAGAMVFVLYHCAFIDLLEISRPHYRLSIFLNTNSVCFVSSMTAISVLDAVISRKMVKWQRFILLISLAACCLLVFSTKSRTGTLALLAGFGARIYLLIGIRRVIVMSMAALVVLMFVPELYLDWAFSFFDTTYALHDKWRSAGTGTGRYEVWNYALQNFFWSNPLLGAGPGSHNIQFPQYTSVSGAHNGLLMNLCELGIVGTFPLVLLWAIALKTIVDHWTEKLSFEISIFLAATVESMGETMFLSMGNPGSLLFLLSLASLSVYALKSHFKKKELNTSLCVESNLKVGTVPVVSSE
jgi:O-antigen ligase